MWGFGDSFDHYNSAVLQAGAKWQVIDGSPTIDGSLGRRGGGCLILNPATQGTQYRVAGWAVNEAIVGFALYYTGTPATRALLIGFGDDDDSQVWLGLNSSAVLGVYRGSGASPLEVYSTGVTPASGSWNYIEFRALIHNTLGEFEVRVNGAVAGAIQTNQDTQNSSTTTITTLRTGTRLGSGSSALAGVRMDDVYLIDTTGAANNDFLGDVRADVIYPDGAGNYQDFTPSTGSDHTALIDENPPDTADYVSSATTGHKETLTLQNLASISGIKCVQVNNYVLKPDAGLAVIQNMIRSNVTDANGSDFAASTAALYSIAGFDLDPNGNVAWTLSAVNALEAGAEITT